MDPFLHAAIEEAESSGDPWAVNPSSGATGLWQFLPSTWAGLVRQGLASGSPQDPLAASRAAYQLSGHGTDWHDWETWLTGAFQRFLGPAQAAATGAALPAAAGALPGLPNPAQAAGDVGSAIAGLPDAVSQQLSSLLGAGVHDIGAFARNQVVALVVALAVALVLFL